MSSVNETIRHLFRHELRAIVREELAPLMTPPSPSTAVSRYLSVKQVSAECHASAKTVRSWIQRGLLVARRAGARSYLITRSDLDRFLSGHGEKSTPRVDDAVDDVLNKVRDRMDGPALM